MSPDALPIELSAGSGVPYYRQIVDQVALLIRSGELSPEEVPDRLAEADEDELGALPEPG